MCKLLAAALLVGSVVAGASSVAPERGNEFVAGVPPVVPEQNDELVAGVRSVVPERGNGFAAGVRRVVPEQDNKVEICAGAAVTPFERRLPEQIRRFTFDGAMLEPFVRLWQSGDRPDLPMSPESVIVYAAPGKPYVVGYERRGCMIAFLAVQHQELWRWLRPSVGWLAERPGPPMPSSRA